VRIDDLLQYRRLLEPPGDSAKGRLGRPKFFHQLAAQLVAGVLGLQKQGNDGDDGIGVGQSVPCLG
jgi:hypothetical protein